MRAVNLLPPERRDAAPRSSLTPLARQPVFLAAGAVVLVVGLVLGIATYVAASSVDAKRRQLAQVERQLAAARAPKDRISPSSLATASARRSTILSLAGRRVSWDGFLGSVSLVLPEDVWLVSLSANPSGVASTASTSSTTTASASTAT
jgi:Tfp pilus assembly protein PilN